MQGESELNRACRYAVVAVFSPHNLKVNSSNWITDEQEMERKSGGEDKGGREGGGRSLQANPRFALTMVREGRGIHRACGEEVARRKQSSALPAAGAEPPASLAVHHYSNESKAGSMLIRGQGEAHTARLIAINKLK